MRIIIATALASALLAGCVAAGTEFHALVMENDHAMTVAPGTDRSHDFLVTVRNQGPVIIGYDADDPEARAKAVIAVVGKQCAGGRIVGETSIEHGSNLRGTVRTYFAKVKCG